MAVALTAADVAGAAVRVGEPGIVDARIYWVETPPSAHGVALLVSCEPGGQLREESSAAMSVRSRLYHNGAGSWCSTPLGLLGIDGATQSVGLMTATTFEPVAESSGGTGWTAAGDPVAVPGTTWVVVVVDARSMDQRRLLALDVATGSRHVLHGTDGFLGEPAVSRDGTEIAWVQWPPRSMPWDAAELWAASIHHVAGGPDLRGSRRVDGGALASCGQPTWLVDGSLAFVSEAAGYWQPWTVDAGGVVRRLSSRRAEFQRPRWTTCRWLAPLGDDGAMLCAFAEGGREHVGVLGADGELEVLDQPCVRVDGLAARDDLAAWVGATPTTQGVVLGARPMSDERLDTPVAIRMPRAPARAMSVPEGFAFTHEGVTLEGAYWAPGAAGPPSTPPLVVSVHPGPTGAVDVSYAPLVDLLTSSGFAVAALDVSGSTGHGRAHRERLRGRFCELDVAEVTAAAVHLIATGRARADATFVRGTSAGGTAALLALCSGVFRGSVSWYPASRFDDDDVGFEEGYLAALLGSGGDSRAPARHASAMRGAVLIVQGAEDPVVDPLETAALVEALRAAIDDVTFVEVPGEGHGFRTAPARALALEAELAFYRRLTVPGPRGPGRYDGPTGQTL